MFGLCGRTSFWALVGAEPSRESRCSRHWYASASVGWLVFSPRPQPFLYRACIILPCRGAVSAPTGQPHQRQQNDEVATAWYTSDTNSPPARIPPRKYLSRELTKSFCREGPPQAAVSLFPRNQGTHDDIATFLCVLHRIPPLLRVLIDR